MTPYMQFISARCRETPKYYSSTPANPHRLS